MRVCDLHFQNMRPVPPPIAIRAADKNVAEKLHLDFLKACASATLALALAGIEAEGAGIQPTLPGRLGLGE